MAEVDIAPSFGAELKVRDAVSRPASHRLHAAGWFQIGQCLGQSSIYRMRLDVCLGQEHSN